MAATPEPKEHTMQDYFATQGLIAVSVGLLLILLHLTVPEYCAALLGQWQAYAEQSPTLVSLWMRIVEWFT